jgi:succinate dehydrogenase/fumarate reductase flavoprotein subunit
MLWENALLNTMEPTGSGGNSLLAAIYSGRTAADSCDRAGEQEVSEPVSKKLDEETEAIRLAVKESMENVSAAHDGSVNSIHKELADIMNKNLGIVRDEEGLSKGIAEIDGMIKIANAGICRSDMPVYMNERTAYMLLMAKAILMSALAREESRGAHYRSDHPETKDSYCGCSTAGYKDGDIVIGFERTKEREDIK